MYLLLEFVKISICNFNVYQNVLYQKYRYLQRMYTEAFSDLPRGGHVLYGLQLLH